METKLYNQEGKEVGKVALPLDIFGVRWKPQLVHQVYTSMMSNARQVLAHTKDRSEVRGGGKKPWRQKGTGRARHGSRRSPLWRTGGVTFGPTKERNFAKKINKKMKTQALHSALSRKFEDSEVLFIDTLGLGEIKTKNAKTVLRALSTVPGFEVLSSKKRNAALVFLPGIDNGVYKSFRNFGNIDVEEFRNMNLLDILKYKFLIIVDPQDIFVRSSKQKTNKQKNTQNTKKAQKLDTKKAN